MADKKTGQMLDWTTEEQYWRNTYTSRPYTTTNRDFDYWRPGYQYGYESGMKYQGKKWNDVENDLQTGWDRFQDRSQATWEQIKDAVRDGWNRVTGNR